MGRERGWRNGIIKVLFISINLTDNSRKFKSVYFQGIICFTSEWHLQVTTEGNDGVGGAQSVMWEGPKM